MHLLGRNKDLHVYGPPQLEEILRIQLEASQTVLIYPFFFHPLNPDVHEPVYEDDKLTVSTIPMNHRIPTCGFLFREKKGRRRLRKQLIESLEIPFDEFVKIKNGADFTHQNGELFKNIDITDDPLIPRSYAFCSDTGYFENIIPIVKNADLLYHEATFMDNMAEVAAEKFHSTTVQAATIAKKANVKQLIIGHFSTRYEEPEELLREAVQVFPLTRLANDGDSFEI
jgi:ribonuclease Z